MSLTVITKARTAYRLPFENLKDDVLGKHYDLTVAFVGARRAEKLNATYRKATYVPNVLSFPLTSSTGEIYITPVIVEKEARHFKLSPRGYAGYLFIHGLLHLKGYDHGTTMERLEKRYMDKYKLS
jgi:rRNA maturation RNase YbeY